MVLEPKVARLNKKYHLNQKSASSGRVYPHLVVNMEALPKVINLLLRCAIGPQQTLNFVSESLCSLV